MIKNFKDSQRKKYSKLQRATPLWQNLTFLPLSLFFWYKCLFIAEKVQVSYSVVSDSLQAYGL